MIKQCVILFVFAFALLKSAAQQYNFHNYSVKDGVAQSQVYSLLQDSRGYLWMGTRGGGLTRFDGINFKTYTVKDGLSNNYVFNVKEDPDGNLWIGTNNGLSKYNGIVFQNFIPPGDSTLVWIQEIDFDKKGRKWLATNYGVLLLNEKNQFVNVSDLVGQKRAVINAIKVDKDGNVWYGSAFGLFKIVKTRKGFEVLKYNNAPGFLINSITSIEEDVRGNIWVGTYGDGAYIYNGKRFSRMDLNNELYKKTILDIYFDKNDNAWLATLTNGVAQYNLSAKSFNWLGEKEGLENNHVRSILQDKSGNYWFGTSGGGVCNYFGKQFTNFDKTSGLGGNFIYSIFRDSKQRLWIGTSDKGLSMLDSSRFINFNAQNGFADVKVKAINEDAQGNLYFGTDGQGLFKYDGLEFKPVEELNKKYIRAIAKDAKNNLWIATAGAGLYKITSIDIGTNIKHYTTKEGLLHDRLTCLHLDKKGKLWYGTENNGLGVIINDSVAVAGPTVKNGLKSNAIRCLEEDSSGYLWIGTAGYGISCLALYQPTSEIRNLDHTNGLTSSNIYLIARDKNNNLFVGSETGLDYLYLDKDRKPLEIKHYGKGEGFSGIETCQNSVCKDADGTIWFGTINCLSKYNPANLVRNNNEPVTTISDVKLFYESISGTEFRNYVGDWNKIAGLDLPYDQNRITFDFMAINFSNPDAVKYQWKLEGSDEGWSPVSKDRSISYSNLGAGDYTFKLKACNEDGVWNKEPVTLSFHISPPFWLRWWFVGLTILLLVALLYVLFKWRENRFKSRAAEAQGKLQMEKDLVELEQKALRLQMNPHFIFNALNSIQSQIGNNNEQAARYYLAKFSRLMRQILDNSRSTSITLEEEISTLENYLLIEKFCNGDRFDYKIHVDENLERDFVKVPPMLLQPFIENSIKHGLKTVEGKRGIIEVAFMETEGVLECSVSDNGIGRAKAGELNKNSKETYHKSTALIVTKERLNILKSDKEINALEIIDLYDEHGNAGGTKVIVRIFI
ncbi:MAG: histidine kinase [Bacteroidia bacterium]|nr:histidine kinase [Bacteroidia bacterium]